MATRKLIGAAAFTAALAAGGVAGATVATPALTGAHEATAPDGETAAEAGRDEPGRRKRHRAAALAAAAQALRMTDEQLRSELAAGKSIAQVAAERGVDKQAVIDALVAAENARLDEMRAQVPDRMAKVVERRGLHERGAGDRHRPAARNHRFAILNAFDDAATALGISRQELREELAAGKSIATVAAERGKDIADVEAAMIADARARIDAAVAAGEIDAAKGAELESKLVEKIDQLVQRENLPLKGHRGPAPAPSTGEAAG